MARIAAAAVVNSTQRVAESRHASQTLDEGYLTFLFVSPEQLASAEMLEAGPKQMVLAYGFEHHPLAATA